MSSHRTIADDRDDAAFRARLAPLAAEVLPGVSRAAADATNDPALPGRRRGLVPARLETGVPSGGPERLAEPVTGHPGPDRAPAEAGKVNDGAARRGSLFRRAGFKAYAGIVAILVLGGGSWLFTQWPRSAPPASRVVTPVTRDDRLAARPEPRAEQPDPAPSAQSPSVRPPDVEAQKMVGLLLQRGQAALAVNDIIAARLMFERAAMLGSAAAATAAGKTYDIQFLLEAGVRGVPADRVSAAAWYRKAAALGDAEAQARLAHIDNGPRP